MYDIFIVTLSMSRFSLQENDKISLKIYKKNEVRTLLSRKETPDCYFAAMLI